MTYPIVVIARLLDLNSKFLQIPLDVPIQKEWAKRLRGKMRKLRAMHVWTKLVFWELLLSYFYHPVCSVIGTEAWELGAYNLRTLSHLISVTFYLELEMTVTLQTFLSRIQDQADFTIKGVIACIILIRRSLNWYLVYILLSMSNS